MRCIYENVEKAIHSAQFLVNDLAELRKQVGDVPELLWCLKHAEQINDYLERLNRPFDKISAKEREKAL
ncbi:hypothetical protein [Acidihalobacter ferrooxydans]|uniref:Uncharacterized protein n=1 Tax=Acidihalobacter ferrooxydans TaxID=1765967 RepID=A0A1P8UFI1_9GAMM|nr:hypothetical protein [Acidihalobacter ferrooxydans]APZ42603.1 hypothetical protein BW247_05405 [Acidihalobacter ferrooxydans]